MEKSTDVIFDVELSASDVQSLNSADAVTGLFARLGYNVNERTEQAPGNLGITADGTVRPIKRIELVANQEGLLQVYLFELTSVTIAQTRALARVFRNRAGNYLLVLTSDYESLDFALLEKYLPPEGNGGSSLAARQIGIRPRVLTVNRRKPGPVDLRVLRRFTWTESDPFAQYEKLLSAYSVADWSEEHFNNRALFSDYYLKERLKGLPEWSEDPKPSYRQLRDLYLGAASKFANKEENSLRKGLLGPALTILGFVAEAGKHSASSAAGPDYRLHSLVELRPGSEKVVRALCLAYPWGRSLDGKDDQRDRETPDENPGATVVSVLEKGEAAWVIVTNGKLWRLYSQHTHSRATNYYEIDLEEALAITSSGTAQVDESFRYFWLLFRCQAFEPAPVRRDGKEEKLSFLDRLRAESEDYAKELGDRLKKRVFEQIFPHLAVGFITHIQARDDKEPQLSEETLRAVFQGTLTLLYRLLFLLYAEARDLLPVREVRGYFEASLTSLNRAVAESAGAVADEADARLKKHFRDDSTQLYDRLLRLFQVVDGGDVALNVPVYNGGLFLSDPNQEDDSPEAAAARFLNATKVPDRFLAQALNLLSRDVDDKRQDLVFIDYKSLGVRQLGSIYEGLLEFKLRIADRKLATVKEKNREVYREFRELDEKEQERAERQGRVLKKGQVYLENDKRERKATGSYYTPDPIVQYIVEHAVGPVLREKFEGMRPKLRLGSVVTSFQGEVNETVERAKGTLTDSESVPLALRGANICLYAVREPSQGEDVRVDTKKFLRSKEEDGKAFAHKYDRVGFQRSSPQNNFRRIIAARVPKGNFCLDTVSYATEESAKINLDLLLSLLNSKILDWYFRLGSTNSKVNEYQFSALPVPAIVSTEQSVDLKGPLKENDWHTLKRVLCSLCSEAGTLPEPVVDALSELSRRIQRIEADRVLKRRSERAHLAAESQTIQDVIDTILFRCYGLSETEASYVAKRLDEML